MIPRRKQETYERKPVGLSYNRGMSSTNGLEGLIRVDRKSVRRAADALGRAFADYPMIRHYFPDESDASQVARHFLSLGVVSGLRTGEVYATSPAMEGVAVWIPPGGYPVSALRQIISSPTLSMLRFALKGGFSLRAVGEHLDRRHKELMPQPHWCLEILGVSPPHQGKGHSSRLVRAMFARADAQSLPIYVDTVGEEAAPIYRHLGFAVVEESIIPRAPLPYSCLVREPAGG